MRCFSFRPLCSYLRLFHKTFLLLKLFELTKTHEIFIRCAQTNGNYRKKNVKFVTGIYVIVFVGMQLFKSLDMLAMSVFGIIGIKEVQK